MWSDLRLGVKQKLAHNKVELKKTGGGLFNKYILTPIDEQVAIICGLYTSVDGVKNSKSFGPQSKEKAGKKSLPNISVSISTEVCESNGTKCMRKAANGNLPSHNKEKPGKKRLPSTSVSIPTLEICEESLTPTAITCEILENEPIVDTVASTSSTPTTSAGVRSRKRKKHITDIADVLSMESKHFSEISSKIEDISRQLNDSKKYLKELSTNVKETHRSLRDIKRLKEKELEEFTRHHYSLEKHLKEKNEMKLKFLEIEQIKLGIESS